MSKTMQSRPQQSPEPRLLTRSGDGTPESRPAASGSLLADIVATLTLTIVSVGFAISLAVLVFDGALKPGLSRAIGSFVVGGGLMAVVVARRSSVVPVATFIQDAPAILMAAVAADFIARGGTGIGDVFVLLVITVLLTALATRLLASFHLGELGRYLPKSVVCASIGGMGWLLFKGGFDVMTSRTLGLGDVRMLLSFDLAKFWLPGTAIGAAGWLASRTQRVPAYVVGLIICFGLAAFYAVVALVSSLDAVESAGWLLGPFPDSGGARLVTPNEFRGANWAAIARTSPEILSVVGIACASQLVHLTGIRCELAPQLDVDDELRLSARANLASALFGVTPGSQGLGYTVLLKRLGATRRAVALVAGGVTIAVGIVGVGAIGYVPRLVVGGMLILAGATLLEDWWRGLSQAERGVEQILGVAVIGAVIKFGLLQGIGLSLIVAAAIFVVRCSRVNPVKSMHTSVDLRSRVPRSPHEQKRLTAIGERLVVVELHGYLSFGSLPALEDRFGGPEFTSPAVEALVIDFGSVAAIDSSARSFIAQLLQGLRTDGVLVWVAALNPRLEAALFASDADPATEVAFAPTLNDALARAEDQLLLSTSSETLQHRLWRDLAKRSPELLSECSRRRYPPGTVVMSQGAPSNGMLFVQNGRLTAFRVASDGTRTRLCCFGEFAIAGEAGLVADTPRGADVIAESVVDGWWLSADRYHELRATKPWLVAELHELSLQTHAEHTNDFSQVGQP